MNRILIIGCSGAGKSTLAQKMGKRLRLPVVHLDAHFWLPGWVECPRAEFDEKIHALISQPEWIIDGNYGRMLNMRIQAADTVIFLDRPRLICLWNCLKRIVSHYGKNRPDMGPGCPEKIDWEFLKWIWQFPGSSRNHVVKTINEYREGRSIYILKSRRSITQFLTSLPDGRKKELNHEC